MRIQEHLFQGFFGIKTKKDALKYYKEKEPKLLDIDKKLDGAIEAFQKKKSHHKQKILAYNAFLQKIDAESWHKLATEIKKLEGMFDEDERANDYEKKEIEYIKDELKHITKGEDDTELKNVEREMSDDTSELLTIVDNTGTLWEQQLGIAEKGDEVLKNTLLHTQLDTIFHEENHLISREEILLKNIDLKLGILLRKTTLKLRELERTTDMNMQYREIRHIR